MVVYEIVSLPAGESVRLTELKMQIEGLHVKLFPSGRLLIGISDVADLFKVFGFSNVQLRVAGIIAASLEEGDSLFEKKRNTCT